MSIFAVAPSLPTLASLLVLLPVLVLSILTALASMFKPKVARIVVRTVWQQKLPLVLLFGGVVGVGWLANAALFRIESKFSVKGTPFAETRGSWPMARASLSRRGWTGEGLSPTRGDKIWSQGRPGEAFLSSPAVVGSRVYAIGSRGDNGVIYCWNAETGSRLWSSAPTGYRATFSSAVISGRYLVCGEGLHQTEGARVVCMDVSEGNEGTVLWTLTTNSHVECTPLIVGDYVYVGAGDDGIYCLRLDPNLTDSQRIVWHAPGSVYPDVETSLAVFDGRVYVGLGIQGQAVCVLDAETGTELSRIKMPYPVFSPPAIDRGKLFVGMGYGDYAKRPDHPAGQVCCLDLATLRIDWTFNTGATVLGAIVAADDQVICGASDGYVYVLSRSGELQHKWNSYAAVLAAPAVTDEFIYLVNQAGMLYALDRQRLDNIWEVRLGHGDRFVSSPVVAHGHVYVGTGEDGFHCVGEPVAREASENWPGYLGGPGASGARDGSLLPAEADILWSVSKLDPNGASFTVTGPIAAIKNTLLLPISDGTRSGLAALDSNNRGRLQWFHETTNAIGISPASIGGNAFIVDGMRGDQGRQIHAIELDTGRLKWERPVDSAASGVLAANLDSLFVQAHHDELLCLSLDGVESWRLPMGPVCEGVDASTPILVAASELPPSLVAVDAASGRLLWRERLDATPTTAPIVRRERIYLSTKSSVECRRLVDGQQVWQLSDETAAAIHQTPERCIFVNANGELVIADAATGRVKSRSRGSVPHSVPLVTRNGIVTVGNRCLRIFGPNGEIDGEKKFGGADLGAFTSAPLLWKGCVYVGARDHGMLAIGGKHAP